MATHRGFVRSIEARGDGMVECVLRSVHTGNQDSSFLIESLDGDLEKVNRRLAQLGLLRDALARTFPVEIQSVMVDTKGRVIEDVVVYPRPSFDGRQGMRVVAGTVIGVSIVERGPEQSTSPYVDEADLAAATILTDSGNVEGVLVDLQRPDPMTAHATLGLIREAHRTRRPLELLVTSEFGTSKAASHRDEEGFDTVPGFVQTCRWKTVPEEDLDYVHAFVERLEQRWESYEAAEPVALSNIEVVYTTAPGQSPEGDVSDNGMFQPETRFAWVHADSPLVDRLRDALRESFQVKLGLAEGGWVHAVEVISKLGSAARPIWIEVNQRSICPPEQGGLCDNTPTIQTPNGADLNRTPYAVAWSGQAFFNEGIWRFLVAADGPVQLQIDGTTPCLDAMTLNAGSVCEGMADSNQGDNAHEPMARFSAEVGYSRRGAVIEKGRGSERCVAHAYLNGVHRVDLQITNRVCRSPFRFLVYRLR